MSGENLLHQLRADLDKEQHSSLSRARMWIVVQCLLLVFVVGYMSWLSSAVSSMDAGSLTRMVAVEIEEEIPNVRMAM